MFAKLLLIPLHPHLLLVYILFSHILILTLALPPLPYPLLLFSLLLYLPSASDLYPNPIMPTSNPNHNAQTHHDMHHPRRYYHRSILIPLWTQQLLLQLLGAILFWYATVLLWSPGHGPGPLPTDGRTRALLAAFAVMYAALVVATMCEVLLWCISRLTPATYLASQIGKTVLSAGVWGVFVWYPKVIRDPVASRREVTVAMSAVFAWLQ